MLRISQTGIRSGEFIQASETGSQNFGTVMQVRGTYPPSHNWTSSLKSDFFGDALGQFAFFSAMLPRDRYDWVIKHAVVAEDLYLEDVADLRLRFLKIGGTFFLKTLRPEQLDALIKGNPDDPEGFWPVRQVYEMFPRKPGSRARKHTLVFRPGNWALVPDASASRNSCRTLFIDLDSGTLTKDETKPVLCSRELAVNESKFNLEIRGTKAAARLFEDWISAGQSLCDLSEASVLRELLSWFPPSLYKSLLQKLIRCRCRSAACPLGRRFPASCAVVVTIAALACHPGAFVPNIQRFVSGLESAAKRLAVTIFEDSSVSDPAVLVSLLAGALVAQSDRSWVPSLSTMHWWLAAALEALECPTVYDYRPDGAPLSSSMPKDAVDANPLHLCAALLSELGSFPGDISMVETIAWRHGKRHTLADVSLEIMPLLQCIDHHSFADIGYFLPLELDSHYSLASAPFAPTFRRLWQEVSSRNPRRGPMPNEADSYVQQARTAQNHLWLLKSGAIQTPRPLLDSGTYDFQYTLDQSWIAGLVGPMDFTVAGLSAMVVLRCDNIYELTAVKRPSREAKELPELKEEEKSRILRLGYRCLRAGVAFKRVPASLPLLQGARIYMLGPDEVGSAETPGEYSTFDLEYVIQDRTGRRLQLDHALTINFSLSLHANPYHGTTPPDPIEWAVKTAGCGVAVQADETLDEILCKTSPEVLSRSLTYLQGYRSEIRLHKISREGDGIDYAVVHEDVGAFGFLASVACLYPAALQLQAQGFVVKNGPLLWTIRDKLAAFFGRMKRVAVPPKIVPDQRRLWEHQEDALKAMIHRRMLGRRGHLIWIPVGMGKTLIFLRYLAHLVETGRCPEFIVYSLPPSAVDSIQRELDSHQLPHRLLDMRQKGRIRSLAPSCVNLVLHDHMRMGGLDAEMKAKAPRTLFVIDEFHKAMSKTIRTSIALDLIRLSADFVGMTGTLIKDTNVDELVSWLEQVVDFEVTESNYWVAVGALVSKKVSTHVAVERIHLEARFEKPQAYYSLVPPTLGGTAAGLDLKGALRYCMEAQTSLLVEQTLHFLKEGEGVFLVAKDLRHQEELARLLSVGSRADAKEPAYKIHLLTSATPITLTPKDPSDVRVVITTTRLAEGYTLTKFRVMLTGVYFSNQATREQLEGRINRIGQPSPWIKIVIVHAGLLSNILKRYETARTLSEALRGFADEVGADYRELASLL